MAILQEMAAKIEALEAVREDYIRFMGLVSMIQNNEVPAWRLKVDLGSQTWALLPDAPPPMPTAQTPPEAASTSGIN